MTTKGMITLFQGSFQLCELCSCTASSKRFVIDLFSLTRRSVILKNFLLTEIILLVS